MKLSLLTLLPMLAASAACLAAEPSAKNAARSDKPAAAAKQVKAARHLLSCLPEKDLAPIRELAATAKPAPAKQPRNILAFGRCEGFVHDAGILALDEAVRQLADKQKIFHADFTTNYDALKSANLARYDAVILNNTTGLKTREHAFLVPDLQAFVKGGKGLAVIHSGADNFNQSPEAAEMVGGHFWGHPWHANGTWAFKLDDPASPVNAAFGGKGFKLSDEIYQQSSPAYNRAKLHVLVSLDRSDPATDQSHVKDQRRADRDNAVSWIRPYGKGRVFYTSFGHDQRACKQRATFDHILAGLQYAIGDLAADDTPAGLSDADLARIKSAAREQEVTVYLQDILANTHCPKVDAANRAKLRELLKDPALTPAAKQALQRLF